MRLGRVICAATSLVAITIPAASLADPQYNGVFVGRVGPGSQDVALERQRTVVKSRSGMLGFGDNSHGYVLTNERSPVRFNTRSPLSLVVRIPQDGQSPDDAFRVFKVISKKGMREFGGMSGFAMFAKNRQLSMVNFTAEPYKTGVVRLILPRDIMPGEYCASASAVSQGSSVFIATETPTVYCFGID